MKLMFAVCKAHPENAMHEAPRGYRGIPPEKFIL